LTWLKRDAQTEPDCFISIINSGASMNTIVKASVASALALGYVSAHASIAQVSSYSAGDVLLFAEVLNSSNAVVGSYAGDTGVKITDVTSGTVTSFSLNASSDTALQSMLTAGQAAGNHIVWSVQGGGGLIGDTQYGDTGAFAGVTTATSNPPTQLAGRTGSNLNGWAALSATITAVQTNAGAGNNSVYASSAAGGGIWDATTVSNNVANWFSNGAPTAVNGLNSSLGSSYNLYGVTGGGTATDKILLTTLGSVSLTASGLSFTAGGTAPVPLPAAVWLLGSGLVGLAGVGRRKAKAAA
jgi:hypothetical protein